MHELGQRTWRLLMRPRLRAKLIPITALATAAVLAATAAWTLDAFQDDMFGLIVAAGSAQSDALRLVLEEQMISADRRLLRRVVDDIGREPDVAWVGLVDIEGRVRVSSDAALVGQVIPRSSPECETCHRLPAPQRKRSVTVLRPGGEVLRTVTPLVNREACHRCHDPAKAFNGVLIVDRSLAPLRRAMASKQDRVLLGAAVAMVVLLIGLGLAIERIVIARLWRLRVAARELGRGDLTARSADRSGDELGELARDFNTMAERLSGAIAGVGAERRRLHELINGIDDGVVLVDAELRVVTSNTALTARLRGRPPPEPGESWAEVAFEAGFLHDGGQPTAAQALATGRLAKQIVRTAGEPERFEEVYAQPILDAEGRPVGVVEVWRDITDRKALEAGLEQSERLAALGMLASGIAHEVGNPLASIATAVQGLLRRLDEPGGLATAELREYLEIVDAQVFRCHAVTERLLGFARLPSKDVSPVDASAAARDVARLVAPHASAQGVEVRTALDEPVLVLADDRLIRQVVLNLVVNALHAMPGGGVLSLSARREDDAGCLVVADTGPGIPEAIRRHLFEPLRRVGAEVFGTGLGLFLSHTLVQRCGGTIAVDSEPGRGATFTVRLRRPDGSEGGPDAPAHRG